MTNEIQDQKQFEETLAQPKPAPKKINYLLLLNLLLFCGLLVLYGLHFFADRQKAGKAGGEEITELAEKISEGKASIAFINSAKLMEEFEMAKKLRADFQAEQTRLDNDLKRRQRNFQAEVEKFQRDIQAGTISVDRAQALEQELMVKQQELYQLNDQFSNQLMQKEMEMNNALLEKISEFLTRYNQEFGYDYILGFTRGGGILYASEQHDITADVLLKLNAEYLATPE